MGWKRIGNHSYLYRSRREGLRVLSEYLGRGETGMLIAQLDKLERQERDESREADRVERQTIEREEQRLTDWFQAVEDVAKGAMLAAGFHLHRGQWRRRRHGKDKQRGG